MTKAASLERRSVIPLATFLWLMVSSATSGAAQTLPRDSVRLSRTGMPDYNVTLHQDGRMTLVYNGIDEGPGGTLVRAYPHDVAWQRWYASPFTMNPGEQIDTTIDPANVKKLMMMLDSAGFFSMPTGCDVMASDRESVVTTVTYFGRTHTVSYNYGCSGASSEPVAMAAEIDSVAGVHRFLHLKPQPPRPKP